MTKQSLDDWKIIIPARLSSTRLPRKPLIEINGLSILNRTYNCALNAVQDPEKIFIATDSYEIKQHCKLFGANVVMTSDKCSTGTDRIAEFADKISTSQYINLQGDEPIFPSDQLKYFIEKVLKDKSNVYTAITKLKTEKDYHNLSIPKMAISTSGRLMYSSRSPIPSNKRGDFNYGYKHVCVYAFNKKHLQLFAKTPSKTPFELEEDLEINRFLELDVNVQCIELQYGGKAVDTQEDLKEVSKIIDLATSKLNSYN